MGLDIFFYKTKRTEWEQLEQDIEEFKKLSDEEKVALREKEETPYDKHPVSDIGYFRKVNFLVSFFDYEDNCSYLEITKWGLRTLLDSCNAVLREHYLAEDFLPNTEGFFFGSTDYDDNYFHNVEEVRNWVSGVLDGLKDDEVVLMYCWW